MESPSHRSKSPAPTIPQLAWIIARDVNRTVGGGMAAMELLRRSFDARKWVDAPTHGLFVAVSRLTPGTNILAYCAAVGWRFHGWRGALAALAAASIPGALIVFSVAATLGRIDRYRAVQIGLSVGMLVASALVFSSAWNLLKPYLRARRWPRAAVIIAVAAALYVAGLTPVRVLLFSAFAGAVLPPAADGPEGPSLRQRRGESSDSPSTHPQ
jgi:chromate transporter